jgi:hypothetical protein
MGARLLISDGHMIPRVNPHVVLSTELVTIKIPDSVGNQVDGPVVKVVMDETEMNYKWQNGQTKCANFAFEAQWINAKPHMVGCSFGCSVPINVGPPHANTNDSTTIMPFMVKGNYDASAFTSHNTLTIEGVRAVAVGADGRYHMTGWSESLLDIDNLKHPYQLGVMISKPASRYDAATALYTHTVTVMVSGVNVPWNRPYRIAQMIQSCLTQTIVVGTTKYAIFGATFSDTMYDVILDTLGVQLTADVQSTSMREFVTRIANALNGTEQTRVGSLLNFVSAITLDDVSRLSDDMKTVVSVLKTAIPLIQSAISVGAVLL